MNDNNNKQAYKVWLDELNTAPSEAFFPTFRQFLDLLIKENPAKIEVLKDKIVRVELEKPLQFIEETKSEVPEISPMFESKEKADTTAQLETLWSQNPSLLPKPRNIITAEQVKLDTVIQGFQNLSYIGEMRQRWEEIKKLQPSLTKTI